MTWIKKLVLLLAAVAQGAQGAPVVSQTETGLKIGGINYSVQEGVVPQAVINATIKHPVFGQAMKEIVAQANAANDNQSGTYTYEQFQKAVVAAKLPEAESSAGGNGTSEPGPSSPTQTPEEANRENGANPSSPSRADKGKGKAPIYPTTPLPAALSEPTPQGRISTLPPIRSSSNGAAEAAETSAAGAARRNGNKPPEAGSSPNGAAAGTAAAAAAGGAAAAATAAAAAAATGVAAGAAAAAMITNKVVPIHKLTKEQRVVLCADIKGHVRPRNTESKMDSLKVKQTLTPKSYHNLLYQVARFGEEVQLTSRLNANTLKHGVAATYPGRNSKEIQSAQSIYNLAVALGSTFKGKRLINLGYQELSDLAGLGCDEIEEEVAGVQKKFREKQAAEEAAEEAAKKGENKNRAEQREEVVGSSGLNFIENNPLQLAEAVNFRKNNPNYEYKNKQKLLENMKEFQIQTLLEQDLSQIDPGKLQTYAKEHYKGVPNEVLGLKTLLPTAKFKNAVKIIGENIHAENVEAFQGRNPEYVFRNANKFMTNYNKQRENAAIRIQSGARGMAARKKMAFPRRLKKDLLEFEAQAEARKRQAEKQKETMKGNRNAAAIQRAANEARAASQRKKNEVARKRMEVADRKRSIQPLLNTKLANIEPTRLTGHAKKFYDSIGNKMASFEELSKLLPEATLRGALNIHDAGLNVKNVEKVKRQKPEYRFTTVNDLVAKSKNSKVANVTRVQSLVRKRAARKESEKLKSNRERQLQALGALAIENINSKKAKEIGQYAQARFTEVKENDFLMKLAKLFPRATLGEIFSMRNPENSVRELVLRRSTTSNVDEKLGDFIRKLPKGVNTVQYDFLMEQRSLRKQASEQNESARARVLREIKRKGKLQAKFNGNPSFEGVNLDALEEKLKFHMQTGAKFAHGTSPENVANTKKKVVSSGNKLLVENLNKWMAAQRLQRPPSAPPPPRRNSASEEQGQRPGARPTSAGARTQFPGNSARRTNGTVPNPVQANKEKEKKIIEQDEAFWIGTENQIKNKVEALFRYAKKEQMALNDARITKILQYEPVQHFQNSEKYLELIRDFERLGVKLGNAQQRALDRKTKQVIESIDKGVFEPATSEWLQAMTRLKRTQIRQIILANPSKNPQFKSFKERFYAVNGPEGEPPPVPPPVPKRSGPKRVGGRPQHPGKNGSSQPTRKQESQEVNVKKILNNLRRTESETKKNELIEQALKYVLKYNDHQNESTSLLLDLKDRDLITEERYYSIMKQLLQKGAKLNGQLSSNTKGKLRIIKDKILNGTYDKTLDSDQGWIRFMSKEMLQDILKQIPPVAASATSPKNMKMKQLIATVQKTLDAKQTRQRERDVPLM